jgi:hypothetical protein
MGGRCLSTGNHRWSTTVGGLRKTRQDAKAELRELLDKAERNVPATPAR